MLDESIGRGEREARALVMLVLVIETIWIFFHKYLPLDASLWALQGTAVREHLAGRAHDGLSLVPIPAANTLVSLVLGFLNFLGSGEVIVRIVLVLTGFLLRGFAMLYLLRVMRVREELVYLMIPVFVWSGIFFIGSVPYLAAETLALFFIAHLLSQDHPRSGTYWFLAFGFALVALAHALAFLVVIALVLCVANEQRRSVHLSQGWLSNINRVAGLILPGCLILLLRIVYPDPVFRLSTSGIIPERPFQHFLFAISPSPVIREAAFPSSDILAITIGGVVILLVIASLIRAFLLPMEEVSWQSRSAKGAGGILIILSLLGFFLLPLGIETFAFFWMAAFLLLAGSYSRGPAVRRGAVDRLLRLVGLIAMIASGIYNGVGINRGSEAASDVRESAIKLMRGEMNYAKTEEHIDSLRIRYLVSPELVEDMSNGSVARFSYTLATPAYMYGEDLLSNASLYQPEAGILRRPEKGLNGTSPAKPIAFASPEAYFDPRLRILAALPDGSGFSQVFGPYARSFTDTTSIRVSNGMAVYKLTIGKLSQKPPVGLAQK